MELVLGTLIGGFTMLAIMASGYILLMGVLAIAVFGGFGLLILGFIHAVLDETVDPFRDLRDSELDINFVEKEVDLRLSQEGKVEESKVDILRIAG